MLGIVPVVDTDGHTKSVDVMTPEDDSVSHATTTASATELEVEVRRLQREITSLHQQNTSQQREIIALHQQNTSQQRDIEQMRGDHNRQIEQIRLQLKQFMKTS